MAQPMIVSVHVPKSAGVSFSALLSASGLNVARDYRYVPWIPLVFLNWLGKAKRLIPAPLYHLTTASTPYSRPTVIHGHFKADQFDRVYRNLKYSIWLRDPADIVASWYWFMNNYPQFAAPWFSECRAAILDDAYLRMAAYLPKNVQTMMLGSKRIEEFDFVGLYEDRAQSIELFRRVFQIDIPSAATGITINKNLDATQQRADGSYLMGDDTRERIYTISDVDVQLYRRAREYHNELKRRFSVLSTADATDVKRSAATAFTHRETVGQVAENTLDALRLAQH
jgi:hypothetical protein